MIAMKDISEIMTVASRLAQYTNLLENTLITRTRKLKVKISTLENKIRALIKK